MTDSHVEQIAQEMRTVRDELRDDVQSVVGRARTLSDWRHYVRSHPWLFIAAGVAVGFLLVPSRVGASPPRGFSARMVAWLAKQVTGSMVSGAVAYASGQLAARSPGQTAENQHDAQSH
jgi:hypothetical protein